MVITGEVRRLPVCRGRKPDGDAGDQLLSCRYTTKLRWGNRWIAGGRHKVLRKTVDCMLLV
jgi:hypothetical protein